MGPRSARALLAMLVGLGLVALLAPPHGASARPAAARGSPPAALAAARTPPLRQPAAVPRIGVLALGSREARAPLIDGFLRGLRELGYAEGRDVVIEYRFAETVARLPDLAAELVRLDVDVILASATQAAVAARDATDSVPIVMGGAGDPVGSGLVADLERPGGNITGLSGGSAELSGGRLERLKQALPGVARVAILRNPAGPLLRPLSPPVEEAARALGVELLPVEYRSADDLEGAFRAAARGRADAVFPLTDAIVTNAQARVAALAAQHRLPAVYELREFAEAGGLMAYGANIPELYRRAAAYVDRILKGAKPGELPIERPRQVDFVINLDTARALGVAIPPSVLAEATELLGQAAPAPPPAAPAQVPWSR